MNNRILEYDMVAQTIGLKCRVKVALVAYTTKTTVVN